MRYYRRVIRIRAEDSPNVQLGLKQQELGLPVTGETVLEGVLSWEEYQKRRATWTASRQLIGLDAMFDESDAELMWSPLWLANSLKLADKLRGKKRRAAGIGIDPGEGRAMTVFTASDELGIIEQESKKTPNTAAIPGLCIAFGRKHGVPPEDWLFDRGGGGLQHADRLRDKGFDVRDVGFGERPVLPVLVAGSHFLDDRIEMRKRQYLYKNLRTQMYWELMEACDPQNGGYAIPPSCVELIRQLGMIPKMLDENGKPKMLPKGTGSRDDKGPTLIKIIGHSPDEADSACLSHHAMTHKESGQLVEAG
jgi:hypothetical protein